MTTTAPAPTAPVDDPNVQDALRRLQLQRYPGISGDPARWLYAAAHQSNGTSPDDVDPDDPDWHAFQTAWSHFGDYDRDQLALVLGWPTEMDDVDFVDQLHALRVVQAEHRRTAAAPAQREHVARVLAVALHSDCPDDELQHAAGAHGAEALRLVDALTAAGLDVRAAVPR